MLWPVRCRLDHTNKTGRKKSRRANVAHVDKRWRSPHGPGAQTLAPLVALSAHAVAPVSADELVTNKTSPPASRLVPLPGRTPPGTPRPAGGLAAASPAHAAPTLVFQTRAASRSSTAKTVWLLHAYTMPWAATGGAVTAPGVAKLQRDDPDKSSTVIPSLPPTMMAGGTPATVGLGQTAVALEAAAAANHFGAPVAASSARTPCPVFRYSVSPLIPTDLQQGPWPGGTHAAVLVRRGRGWHGAGGVAHGFGSPRPHSLSTTAAKVGWRAVWACTGQQSAVPCKCKCRRRWWARV